MRLKLSVVASLFLLACTSNPPPPPEVEKVSDNVFIVRTDEKIADIAAVVCQGKRATWALQEGKWGAPDVYMVSCT